MFWTGVKHTRGSGVGWAPHNIAVTVQQGPSSFPRLRSSCSLTSRCLTLERVQPCEWSLFVKLELTYDLCTAGTLCSNERNLMSEWGVVELAHLMYIIANALHAMSRYRSRHVWTHETPNF